MKDQNENQKSGLRSTGGGGGRDGGRVFLGLLPSLGI